MNIHSVPFPHAIVKNAFDADLCHAAADAWPAPDWNGWGAVYQQDHQRKRACNRWEDMPEPCRRLLGEMLFLDVSAFGLGKLIADTGLWGGGMQDMGAGDVLGEHLDADTHRLSGLRRKLNAILFLSPEWECSWGGQLELRYLGFWRPIAFITPAAGTLVLFGTGDRTWHSVRRLTCPPDARRMTLACWWYGPPGEGKRDRAQFAEAGDGVNQKSSMT